MQRQQADAGPISLLQLVVVADWAGRSLVLRGGKAQLFLYGRARTERSHLCLSAKHHPGSSHEQEDLDCVSEVSVGVATNLLVGHGNVKQCLPETLQGSLGEGIPILLQIVCIGADNLRPGRQRQMT